MEQKALALTLYLASLNARRQLSALHVARLEILRLLHCKVPGTQDIPAASGSAMARAHLERRLPKAIESKCILHKCVKLLD